MARWHVERVARTEFALGPVVHPQRHPPVEYVTDVIDLTGIRARDRLDVLRPAPAGFERTAADGVTVQVDELDAALAVGELAHLVGVLEPFACELCHRSSNLLSARCCCPG